MHLLRRLERGLQSNQRRRAKRLRREKSYQQSSLKVEAGSEVLLEAAVARGSVAVAGPQGSCLETAGPTHWGPAGEPRDSPAAHHIGAMERWLLESRIVPETTVEGARRRHSHSIRNSHRRLAGISNALYARGVVDLQ